MSSCSLVSCEVRHKFKTKVFKKYAMRTFVRSLFLAGHFVLLISDISKIKCELVDLSLFLAFYCLRAA